MRAPSTNPITLPFGSTDAPYSATDRHRGTDFSYQPDKTIYAPFAGSVTLIPNNGNDGNGVYMSTGNQFHGLLHTSQYLVKNGDHVEEGQPIAIMGDSGYAIGVHLHWAVKVNGVFVDPMSVIPQGEETMVQDTDWDFDVLSQTFKDCTGRALTRDEFKGQVGRKWQDVLVTFQGSPETAAYRQKAESATDDVTTLEKGLYRVA